MHPADEADTISPDVEVKLEASATIQRRRDNTAVEPRADCRNPEAPAAAPKDADKAPLTVRAAINGLNSMGSPEMLHTWAEAHKDLIAELPEDQQEAIREAYVARLTAVKDAPLEAAQ